MGKGLKKLIADGYLSRSPADVVAFLRLCGDRLSAREVCVNQHVQFRWRECTVCCAQIGDFLGDIGRGAEEEEWYKQIRATYMAGIGIRAYDAAALWLLTTACA